MLERCWGKMRDALLNLPAFAGVCPHLCIWQRGHFLMERCDELLWPEAGCGKAIGLFQVARDVCVENGVTLDSWYPRIRMAFPHLCRDSAGLFAQEMGLW